MSSAPLGAIVALDDGRMRKLGVVIFARDEEAFVFTGAGVVRKTRRDSVRTLNQEEAPPELLEVAERARAFGELAEGERVRFDEGSRGGGMLVEKCRFGAIVARADGSFVGVGFRRIWRQASSE